MFSLCSLAMSGHRRVWCSVTTARRLCISQWRWMRVASHRYYCFSPGSPTKPSKTHSTLRSQQVGLSGSRAYATSLPSNAAVHCISLLLVTAFACTVSEIDTHSLKRLREGVCGLNADLLHSFRECRIRGAGIRRGIPVVCWMVDGCRCVAWMSSGSSSLRSRRLFCPFCTCHYPVQSSTKLKRRYAMYACVTMASHFFEEWGRVN